MKDNGRSGKAQSVLGLIDAEKLGFTLPHEHILADFSFRVDFALPDDPREKELPYQKVSLENIGWIRSHRFSNADNLKLNDEETAIFEIGRFKDAGGNTIVEVTPNHVGRNPSGLARISQATGVNIIMGTSYYIATSHRPEMKMDSKTEDDLAREFIQDINEGVGDTGIHAGFIGEVSCSHPLDKNERKALVGAALAQQETGASISTHPGAIQDSPFEILEVLKKSGADLSRVIMCHTTAAFPISGRDARRKLGYDDRLFGTMRLALGQGIEPVHMARGAAAALMCVRGGAPETREDVVATLREVWGEQTDAFADHLITLTWEAMPSRPGDGTAKP